MEKKDKVIQLTESELSELIRKSVLDCHLDDDMSPHRLEDYAGKTFKFFTSDGLGLVKHVLFTFEKVQKMELDKTVLVGTVTFNRTQISGSRITVDFLGNKVTYRERGTRHLYTLEVDNRSKSLWESLLSQIK